MEEVKYGESDKPDESDGLDGLDSDWDDFDYEYEYISPSEEIWNEDVCDVIHKLEEDGYELSRDLFMKDDLEEFDVSGPFEWDNLYARVLVDVTEGKKKAGVTYAEDEFAKKTIMSILEDLAGEKTGWIIEDLTQTDK